MAARPKGQNKRDHVVTATDAEWARLGEAADAAGMSRSRFILHAVNPKFPLSSATESSQAGDSGDKMV